MAVTLGTLLSASTVASAATLTVNTTADNMLGGGDGGLCTLRDAIGAVDAPNSATTCDTAGAGANTIVLAADTYTLDDAFPILGTLPPGCFHGQSRPADDDNSEGALTVLGSVQNLTITGAGTAITVINACRLGDRALNVEAGASVTVRDLTIIDGNAPDGAEGTSSVDSGVGGAGQNGGGILNDGTLTLDHVTVSDSQAGPGGLGAAGSPQGGSGGFGGDGGGVFNDGSLTLSDSTISGNSAGVGGNGQAGATNSGTDGIGGSGGDGGSGGGLYSTGQLTISGSTLNGNQTGAGGDGATGASSSTINGGNGGSGGEGGAGGGIAASGGTLSLTNDTITANDDGNGGQSAVAGAGAGGDIRIGGTGGNGGNGGNGGGLAATGLSSSVLENVTVADNAVGQGQPGAASVDSGGAGTAGANGVGGGAFVEMNSPTTLIGTLLVSNGSGGECATSVSTPIASVFIDGGHNIVFAPPTVSTHPPANELCPSTFGTGDPKLGPLQNNLGPTETMALGPGSAAIDQIPPGPDCPATDQRGFKRPSGPACDVGAYEVTPPAVSVAAASAVSPTQATLHGTVTANALTATVEFEFGTTTAYGSSTTEERVTGVQPSTTSTQLTGLRPHTTYDYRVVASSGDGTSDSPNATFTTGIPPLAGLALSPKKFHPGKNGGTKISYSDAVAALAKFVVLMVEPGIERHRACVKPGPHQHGKKCTRLVKLGTIAHQDHVGSNHFHFSGVIAGRKLAAGRYMLEATPQLQGASGATVSQAFRVA